MICIIKPLLSSLLILHKHPFYKLQNSKTPNNHIDMENKITRRDAIGKIAATVAIAAVAPGALAQSQNSNTNKANAKELTDPRNKYPKPPFNKQSQPFPGLAGKMTPVPDHGEKSYVGSGRLQGRKALITGGDSGIGRAAAIAYAREGADVAINYLPAEEEDAKQVIELIKKEGRKGIAIPGDIRSEAFCKQLVSQAVQQLGGLDILINNAGHQKANESILDLSSDDFDWTMKTNIYAPFWITKPAYLI